MEAILKFKLPEDDLELNIALKSSEYYNCLYRLREKIDRYLHAHDISAKEESMLAHLREIIPEEFK